MSYKQQLLSKEESIYDFYQDAYHRHLDEDYICVDKLELDLDLAGYEFSQESFDANANTHDPEVIVGSRMNSFVLPADDKNSKLIRKKLGLKYSHIFVNLQNPGTVARVHFDINKGFFINALPDDLANSLTPEKVRKFVWFLEDQQPGQMFMMGNSYLRWKAFDCFEWPWYMLHATANASEVNRTAMIITGI